MAELSIFEAPDVKEVILVPKNPYKQRNVMQTKSLQTVEMIVGKLSI